MKAVLMVAYHYPPEGGSSGVLRTLKFSKYLPRHGWIPHILTVRESLYEAKDKHLLRDIPPEAVIHRTFALDTARHLAVARRYPALFSVPDRLVSWVPFGVARGLKVIHKNKIRALYSTSPLPTAHLIAAALKAITGLPWVADFRDPWIEEGLHPRPRTLRSWVESGLERFVVRHADRLIVTTPYLQRDFLSRYPELLSDKTRTIYNGYDEEDFQNRGDGHPIRNDRFEIIHAGLLTPDFRNPFPFLRVLAKLIADARLCRDVVRVTLLGGGSYVFSKNFIAGVNRLGLDDVVEITDRVSHPDALQRLRQAAILLLMQASDDTRSLIPAKSFEYLRVGRPILALTLEGATADLLTTMEHCYVVNPNDESSLEHAVMLLYRLWKQSPNGIQVSRPIRRYERSNLTVELAQLLEDLVGRVASTDH